MFHCWRHIQARGDDPRLHSISGLMDSSTVIEIQLTPAISNYAGIVEKRWNAVDNNIMKQCEFLLCRNRQMTLEVDFRIEIKLKFTVRNESHTKILYPGLKRNRQKQNQRSC